MVRPAEAHQQWRWLGWWLCFDADLQGHPEIPRSTEKPNFGCDMDITVEGRGAELRGKKGGLKTWVVVAILFASLGI